MLAESEVRSRMQKVVAEILEIDPSLVHTDSRLREDLGMDSLGSLELLSSISEELGIHLDIDDAMGIVTFDDACTFVVRAMHAPDAEKAARSARA